MMETGTDAREQTLAVNSAVSRVRLMDVGGANLMSSPAHTPTPKTSMHEIDDSAAPRSTPPALCDLGSLRS